MHRKTLSYMIVVFAGISFLSIFLFGLTPKSFLHKTWKSAFPDSTNGIQTQDTTPKIKPQKQVDKELNTAYIFDHIIEEMIKREYHTLPIGECMGKIGNMLIGTRYVGGTLELHPERCVIDLNGLDCVTFFENTLNIARTAKIKEHELATNPNAITFRDVLDQVEFTRYRDGQMDGYTSRLHYTSEWIIDNVKKGVVKDLTKELGGKPFPVKVGFMSTNPQYYPQLVAEPTLVRKIQGLEEELNAKKHWYIPNAQVKDIESKLQTGDIIAIATNKTGLDYSHTGMIIKNAKGMALFLHASSGKKRVYLDKRISSCLSESSTSIGISVLRPIDPNHESEEIIEEESAY
ncbi:MAG: N-acetylmuramoyl-L-alanine amidase-like domain-containing protein [Candidatus Kapaibacteriota bacterium]